MTLPAEEPAIDCTAERYRLHPILLKLLETPGGRDALRSLRTHCRYPKVFMSDSAYRLCSYARIIRDDVLSEESREAVKRMLYIKHGEIFVKDPWV